MFSIHNSSLYVLSPQFYYGARHLSCLRSETIKAQNFDLPEIEEETPSSSIPATVGSKFKFKKVSDRASKEKNPTGIEDILLEPTQPLSDVEIAGAKIHDETSECSLHV